ncbi:hypothetical protein [Desulfovibrio piger]|mgnify:FL=1|uniref:hypothetical protein n=1 Tax=Desulfovibrio piger TaxID=901 RepID=UPI0026EE01D9|nr:hypothetical protein [Desulfovibrio piger]
MSENLQSHALKLLDSLLKQEIGKRRVKNSSAFLTTLTGNPPWDKRPDIWAPDWCQGWSFAPEYAMAEALGIELTPRTRLEKVLDSEGRPVPELDAAGKPKISKGKPVYQKVQHRYSVWTQSTAFDFRAGYTIHAAAARQGQNWQEQLAHSPVTLQIVDAMPASPGSTKIDRDPGFVTFKVYQRTQAGDGIALQGQHTLTQEDFVRFLVSGKMPEEINPGA